MKNTLAALGLPLVASFALAAPPDAGSLLREELRRDEPTLPAMPPKPTTAETTKPEADAGLKIAVTAFKIVGLTALPEVEAQAFLADHLHQSMTLNALHRVAAKFEQWLRNKGLFAARAYIPPQDIQNGVVEIRVIEGRVEGIDIKRAPDMRLSEDMLRATLSGVLPPGSALELTQLERGLLLLNDLPVTSARAVLTPGKELGTSRVLIEAAQGAVVSGNVELDNTGSRFTGENRLSAMLSINDAWGLGDQWSLRAAHSQGSDFFRLGWTVPIGTEGWKAGVSVINSRYALCCESSVGNLDSNGEASAYSAFVSYPVIRTRLSNLSVSTSMAQREFVNRSLGATTSDKKSNSLTLGLSGDWSDMEGLGAYHTWSVQWVNGNVDLSGHAANKTQDATTARSNGGFDKWVGQISRLQRLSEVSAVYIAVSGQMARKNLDSSEKFGLGGLQGVRAYPTGEASGDEGWLLTAEWRRELNRQWRAALFLDYGEVTLHRSPWANWNAATPNTPNRYALSGVGASLVFTPTRDSRITATLASRLGQNPARDTTGRDSDNRPARIKLWLQGSMAF